MTGRYGTVISQKDTTRNRAYCLLCHTLVESIRRHDWQQCKCCNLHVDGGTDYWHIGWGNGSAVLRVHDNTITEELIADLASFLSVNQMHALFNNRTDVMKYMFCLSMLRGEV